MANYENTKNKIRHNWEGSQANQFTIKDQHGIEDLKENQVVLLKSTNSVFSKTSNLSTDWAPMAAAWTNVSDYAIPNRFINWIISSIIPEDDISLVRFEVEYRITGTENPLFIPLIIYETFIEVKDVVGNDILKEVTWYVGWNLRSVTIPATTIPVGDFEARLLLVIPNNNLYI